MQVEFNGKSYALDIEDIEVDHARIIKRYCGYTLKALEENLAEGDPDALTCLYWLMLKQNGEDHRIDSLHFKIVRFAKAVGDAQLAEAADQALEREAADPKDDSEG